MKLLLILNTYDILSGRIYNITESLDLMVSPFRVQLPNDPYHSFYR